MTENCSCDSKQEEVKQEEKVDETPSWAKNLIDTVTQLQTNYSSLSGKLEQLKSVEVATGVRPQPTAEVAAENEPFSLAKIGEKFNKWVNSSRENPFSFDIPLDVLRGYSVTTVKTPNGVREAFTNRYAQSRKITEALTYTGTHATQDLDNQLLIEPGGLTFAPVLQFAKYKEVGQGMDRARFFKHGIPASDSQTAGTTATEASLDIESVEVTPSTITGVYLKVDTDDIENVPYDVLQTVVNASSMGFEDFIATDMLDTVSKEGTLTPGKWIRGDTGATVSSSDTASVTLDPTGLAVAQEYFSDKGYLRGGVSPVVFISPQQHRELIEDSEVERFVYGTKPDVATNFKLDRFYGFDIVVTNAIQKQTAQTNSAWNAIACIPNHSYGIASKRNVTVKFHEVPEDNQIRVTTNWRVKSGVIDSASIVRISTTAS